MLRGKYAFLLCVLAGTASSAEPLPAAVDRLSGAFAGWAEIDADGRLQSFAPDGKANPVLAGAVLNQLKQIRFTPARDASRAIPVRTYLRGGYEIQADGEDYVLRVADVRAGPKITKLVFPRFPGRTGAMREVSWARVRFISGTDGKAKGVIIEALVGSEEVRRTVHQSMAQWRLEPETSNGKPIETLLRQDFAYRWEKQALQVPECPSDQSGRVLAPMQRSCGELLDFALSEQRLPRQVRVSQP